MPPINYFIVLAILLIPSLVSGKIYRYVDDNGHVVFTDKPVPGSHEITVISNPTPALPPPPPTDTSEATAKGEATPDLLDAPQYLILIKKPLPGSSLEQAANTETTVEVDIAPPLQKTENLVILVDGKPVGEPQHTLLFKIPPLTRGQHTIQVKAFNTVNAELRGQSAVITVNQNKPMATGTAGAPAPAGYIDPAATAEKAKLGQQDPRSGKPPVTPTAPLQPKPGTTPNSPAQPKPGETPTPPAQPSP